MSALTTTARRRLPPSRKMTGADVILLAAASFERDFTKWELAVACWKIDPNRYGMRGFETQHPDTNRVMMEVVGHKPKSPVTLGYIESPAPCIYRMTAKGRSAIAGLRADVASDDEGNGIYQSLMSFSNDSAFILWKSNPAEPSEFRSLRDAFRRTDAIATIRQRIQAAREWCRSRRVEAVVYYGSTTTHPPISLADLSDIDDFLTAMQHRFPQLRERQAKRA